MRIRKVIQRRIRRKSADVDIAGGLNAVISANVNEPRGAYTHVSSRQRVVEQSGGDDPDRVDDEGKE